MFKYLFLFCFFAGAVGFAVLTTTPAPNPQMPIEKTIDNDRFFETAEPETGGFK